MSLNSRMHAIYRLKIQFQVYKFELFHNLYYLTTSIESPSIAQTNTKNYVGLQRFVPKCLSCYRGPSLGLVTCWLVILS